MQKTKSTRHFSQKLKKKLELSNFKKLIHPESVFFSPKMFEPDKLFKKPEAMLRVFFNEKLEKNLRPPP
jgi:hypothetical protein